MHKDIGSGLYHSLEHSFCFDWYIGIAIFFYIAPGFYSDFFLCFLWLIPLKAWKCSGLSTRYRVFSRILFLLFDWSCSSLVKRVDAYILLLHDFSAFCSISSRIICALIMNVFVRLIPYITQWLDSMNVLYFRNWL